MNGPCPWHYEWRNPRADPAVHFIEVRSRRVHLARCGDNPTGTWVVEPARNLVWNQDGDLRTKFLSGIGTPHSVAASTRSSEARVSKSLACPIWRLERIQSGRHR